jgi:glucosamine kinase
MPYSRVLGLDVGGTWTRALLATSSGERLGTGTAPGGNPITHGPDTAMDRMADAVHDALAASPPGVVEACVIGLAGSGKYATEADLADVARRIRSRLDLSCDVRVVGDIAVAFAAGTSRSRGSILLAGTGAIAGRVQDRELTSIQGGYGWLLGDEE